MTVPLPEPYFPLARKQRRDGAYEVHPAFTADQLRAYGAACRADERERLAQLFDAPLTLHGEAEEWSREVAARIRNMEPT